MNSQLDRANLRGPTVYSNWVVPGVVMVGAYPGMMDDQQNDYNLKLFLKLGLDTFVCLQSELTLEIPENIWRTGEGLRPYFLDFKRITKRSMKWHHCPIIDCNVTEDEVVETLVEALLVDIEEGRKLYVHCWGGHGRAGIIVCLLLARLYNLPAKEALKRVQKYHDCRIEPQQCKSPQTLVQRDQVRRLLKKWSESGVYKPMVIQYEAVLKSAFPAIERPGSRSGASRAVRRASRAVSNGGNSNSRALVLAKGGASSRNSSMAKGSSSMPKGSNLRAQITSLYEAHCPAKVADIDAVMHRFRGRETELLSKVKLKYTDGS
jgi:hypothetical protein